MSHARPAAALVAAAVAALLLALPSAFAGAAPAQRTTIPSCSGKPLFKPVKITIACADGNYFADHLTWRSWTPRRAVARGIAHYNDCRPDCADGHFHRARAIVTLSLPRRCGAHANRSFSRIAVKARHVSRRPIVLACGTV